MAYPILYTTEDGRSQIKLRARDQTVRLTQREMARLFDMSTDNVACTFSYRGILGSCFRW